VPAAIKKNRRKSFELVSKSRVSNFSNFVAEIYYARFGNNEDAVEFLPGKKLTKSTKRIGIYSLTDHGQPAINQE